MQQQHMSKVKQIWLIGFMGLVSATGPLSMDMYLPGLPQMQHYFGSSASMLQLSITFCLVGLAVGQLFIGPLSDHIGRRIPLMVGFALYGLTSLACVFAPNIWIFILLRLIQGLAGSTGQVLSRAVTRDMFEGKELTRFYAMLMAVNGVFPIISPIIGGILLPFVHWEGIFILLFVIGVLTVIGVFFTIPETLPITSRRDEPILNSFKSMLKMFSHRRFVLIALVQGLIFGALFSYISASSFVFQNYFHMTVGQFSFLYAINGLGIILGNNLPGYLTDYISNQRILMGALVVGLFASVLMVGSLFVSPMAILVIIPLFIVIFCVGIVNTVATSMAMGIEGRENGGSASAVLGLLMNIIGALASPIAGVMGAHSYAPMAILIFGCELSGLALFYLSNRVRRVTN
ncbi:multidrug effflux MFS transporter [Pediococcus argentinicus]|uniref:multidrug effflux MFS transporter n=1 Tax=Pediococcus argentinicus TaxID=480391 RepID=UPI00338D9C1F